MFSFAFEKQFFIFTPPVITQYRIASTADRRLKTKYVFLTGQDSFPDCARCSFTVNVVLGRSFLNIYRVRDAFRVVKILYIMSVIRRCPGWPTDGTRIVFRRNEIRTVLTRATGERFTDVGRLPVTDHGLGVRLDGDRVPDQRARQQQQQQRHDATVVSVIRRHRAGVSCSDGRYPSRGYARVRQRGIIYSET